jgi:hypothetical protein
MGHDRHRPVRRGPSSPAKTTWYYFAGLTPEVAWTLGETGRFEHHLAGMKRMFIRGNENGDGPGLGDPPFELIQLAWG